MKLSSSRIMALLFPLLVVLDTNSAMAAGSDLAAFKQAIRAKYDLKEKAFAAGDPDPIINHFYAADVVSTDEQGNTHVGRDELRPLYKEVTAGHFVRIESVYTHVNGNVGWDWANFFVTPKQPGTEEPFSFKILFLWEKVNGEWWCKGDMYTLGEFKKHVTE
jgi:ketosteroid isomerase-like protein